MTERLKRLTCRDEIEPFLRGNPFLHIYALGDLDAAFWPHTVWYGHETDGKINAVLLLYTAFEIPTLMALGDQPYEPLWELLGAARHLLPAHIYAHLSPGCMAALGTSARVESRGPHLKMALTQARLDVPHKECVERLTMVAVDELRSLYAVGYPANWFDPRQIEIGYYGLRVDGQLVSAAGLHVYAPTQRVAALGNIVTHPDQRGHGYAAAVTARLCAELQPTVDYIGLNVKADNAAAVQCYRRLGFTPIAEYEEATLWLAPL